MKLDESTEVISVSVIDTTSGKEEALFERPGSMCHFKNPFTFGNYKIQLRIDWSDMVNGDPTLDADIWIEDSLGRKNFLDNDSWHHTMKQLDPATRELLYTFQFQSLALRLKTKKTVAKTFTVDAVLVDHPVGFKLNGNPVNVTFTPPRL